MKRGLLNPGKWEKRVRLRLALGGLVALGYIGYHWQPWEYDFVPRQLPNKGIRVDPDSQRLFAKGAKVLVITAHPDDSEFYIGGSLWQLGATADIRQIICTDGDKAYYGVFTEADKNRAVRRKEAVASNKAWGGKGVTFLSEPDGRVRATDALVSRLAELMRRFQPEYVLAFDGEFPPSLSHQDHRRVGDAALAAARKCQVPKWCLLFSTIAANYVFDITKTWGKKQELMAYHPSQWSGDRFLRTTNYVQEKAEEYGHQFGIGLGEGFRCVRIEQ